MNIAIVTGSRADRGPLEMVFAALDDHGAPDGKPMFPRWIDVSPSAYKPNFGSECVQIAAAAATQVSGELAAIPTDLVVVHGDRYEILGAVTGANMMGVPVAHLAGGDVTEGSNDDCYRHAITKLAHLHFPNSEKSAARILQMGEEPWRVHMVGDPAVDRILRTQLLSRDDLLRQIGLQSPRNAILAVLLHPTPQDTQREIDALLGALRGMPDNVGIVLLGPCADPGHKRIELAWQLLASARPNTVYHENLAGDVFLSLLKHCDCLVGNSSAAFYEAPLFGTPAVDIGKRQRGRRIRGRISPDTPADKEHISHWISYLMADPKEPQNMGDGHAAEWIADVIRNIRDPKSLLRKRFQRVDLGRDSPFAAVGDVP